MPAAAMITLTPRRAAVDAYSATPRGSRWAESTRNSCEIPRSLSSSSAGSIASRSDSEPIRMPTRGPSSWNSSKMANGCGAASDRDMDSLESDVAPVVHAREVYALDGRVRPLPGLRARVTERRHVEDAAARGQERVLP